MNTGSLLMGWRLGEYDMIYVNHNSILTRDLLWSGIPLTNKFLRRQRWLQDNIDQLAQVFGREVVGVHNPT